MKPDPSEIFKILGVDTRIKIIHLMKVKGPIGAKYIAEQLGITPAAASQHLKILKQAGFVTSERDGYRIPYSINAEAMGHCQQMMAEVCECDCHGTMKHHKRKVDDLTLKSLKAYKGELEKELQSIEQKIGEMEGKME